MSSQVEIITGLPGAGKTALLLAEYRRALKTGFREGRVGQTLWISPTERVREQVLSELLSPELPVCMAPQVYTFEGFADEILTHTLHKIIPIGESAKRTILRTIINELKRNNELPYFKQVAETTGFLNLVAGFIAELKREETWPEDFVAAAQSLGSGFHRKHQELGLIYTKYQELLLETGKYDAEGRFWSAKTILESGQRDPFRELQLVVVDGFSDFTFTQNAILQLMTGWVGKLMVSLPFCPDDPRNDLFEKPRNQFLRLKTLEQSDVQFAVRNIIASPHRTPTPLHPALDQIARYLFDSPRAVVPLDQAEGIELLLQTGKLGEVQLLGDRIKRAILKGTPPENIVVAFRSLGEYGDLIREIWTAAGIPFWCQAGLPLSRSSLLKTLFNLIQLEIEDWPFDRLMSVLGSTHFRPRWESWRDGEARSHLSRVLRYHHVASGRKTMLDVLAADLHVDKNFTGNTEIARVFLEEFSKAMASLRKQQTFADWIEQLTLLARTLGIIPAEFEGIGDASREPSLFTDEPLELTPAEEQDRATWEIFQRVARETIRLDQQPGRTPRKLRITEFVQQFSDLLRSEQLPPAGTPRGCVRVIEATHVRNLEVPWLILAGLSETSFPTSGGEGNFYNDHERQRMNDQGLAMGNRASHTQEEMLLFYRILTRARQRLTLSYPAIGSQGEQLFPSPYLTAVQNLFTPEALPPQRLGQLDPVPDRNHILTPADLRVIAMEESLKGNPELLRLQFESEQTEPTLRNVLSCVEMAAARFQQRGLTHYEGRLRLREHRERLQKDYGPRQQFSTTQLEGLATCGFRFFTENILKVEPVESPEVATDYILRGILVHTVLANLHREAREWENSLPEEIQQKTATRFRELVQHELKKRRAASDLHRALTEVERELLEEWSQAYAEQWMNYREQFHKLWGTTPDPCLMEVGFGDVPEEEGAHNEIFIPLRFGEGDRAVIVRGRIDRIDKGTVQGQTVFNIVDYKTGKPPRFKWESFEQGRSLQLAIYTVAARKSKLLDADAKPYQMGYWGVREKGFVLGLMDRAKSNAPVDDDVVTDMEKHLHQRVPELVQQLREGQFWIYNQDEDCTGRCPYSTVCRVNQIRPLEQMLAKHPQAEPGGAANG